MRKHEIRNGTYTQHIWTKDDGKRKEKLIRDKANPNKVLMDRIFMNGFKMELFYYKDKPEDLFLGVGDKLTLLQEHEIKAIYRMAMVAGNKMGIMGRYCNKNRVKEFKKLMKEKNEVKEPISSRTLEETDPFRLRMREILSKKKHL